MKRLSKRTKIILYSVISIFLLLLIGMIKIERYYYSELPIVDSTKLNDPDNYHLINRQVLHDDSYSEELIIDYYQILNETSDGYDNYVVVITVNLTQKKNISKDLVSDYDQIKSITLKTDVNPDETNYRITHYPQGHLLYDWNFSFSLQNLIGKRDLNNAKNSVGYNHRGTNTPVGVYQANFEYHDYVDNSSVSTFYYMSVPEDEEVVNFPLTYKIETEQVELYPFSIKNTTTSGEWVTITYNYTKDRE